MTAIISMYGEHLSTIFSSDKIVELNTPEGCLAVCDPPKQNMQYVDGKWVDIPDRPSEYHLFDYALRQWIDQRSLDVIKDQKWTEIKSQRDQLEFGGFEFEGNIYDSDQVSQGRIMGAAYAGIDQTWTLADNTTAELSALQLQQLYVVLQAHIASVHERGRIARVAVETASNKDEIESILL